jgi:hypothetical protein
MDASDQGSDPLDRFTENPSAEANNESARAPDMVPRADSVFDAAADLAPDDSLLGVVTTYLEAPSNIDHALDQLTTSTDLFDVPALNFDGPAANFDDSDNHGD